MYSSTNVLKVPPVKGVCLVCVWPEILNLASISLVFDSSNAVLGETFTHTPPKKGNQTFVLRETNFVLHRKQNKYHGHSCEGGLLRAGVCGHGFELQRLIFSTCLASESSWLDVNEFAL